MKRNQSTQNANVVDVNVGENNQSVVFIMCNIGEEVSLRSGIWIMVVVTT